MNTDMINALLKIAEGITEFAKAQTVETPHQDKPNPLVLVGSVVKINEYPTTTITSDENGTYDLWPGGSGVFFTGELKYRKELMNYVNRHHNDEYLYNQYTTNIVLVQKYLESKGKRYIMVDTFGNHQAKQRQSNGLISQVNDQYYIGWPTESMMEWTYKTPQGPAGHFLEEGHQKVAEKINEYIRNIGWVS